MKVTIKIVLTMTLALIAGYPVHAQLNLGPESTALAGSFATQSRGEDALGWNPANLGYFDNPNFSIGLLSPNVQLNNSTFSPAWYNTYLFKGYLNEADVQDLLSSFPDRGWNGNTLVRMNLLSMSVGNFAFGIAPELMVHGVLPKEVFEFIFTGNHLGQAIDLSSIDFSSQAVVPVSFGYGQALDLPVIDEFVHQLYVGGAAKILMGIAAVQVEEFNGSITLDTSAVSADGYAETSTAFGGSGFALDIGVAADITSRLSAGVSLNNLFGSVSWSADNSERAIFEFSGEIPSSEMEQADSLLDTFVETDTTLPRDAFKTPYPASLMAGVEYSDLIPGLTLYGNYLQYFSDSYFFKATPRISVGAEFHVTPWFPVRTGIAIGGYEGFQWGTGFGLTFNHYHLDIGFSQEHGMFNYAKGMSITIGQTILF